MRGGNLVIVLSILLLTSCGFVEPEKASAEDSALVMEGINSNDPSKCAQVSSDEYKTRCYNAIARSTKNVDLCSKIPGETSEENCLKDLAESKGDIKVCDMIADKSEVADCYLEVAIDQKDVKICPKITEQEDRDNCYQYLGRVGDDRSVCDKIEKDPEGKDECLHDVSVRLDDMDICEDVQDPDEEASCRLHIMGNKPNAANCDTADDKYSCFRDEAAKGDISLCDYIESEYDRDRCVSDIAQREFSRDTCQGIKDQEMKQECLDEVQSQCDWRKQMIPDLLPEGCG